MKKSLLVLAVLLTMVAFSVTAVDDVTGDLVLQGTVDDSITLSVDEATNADTLSLTSNATLLEVGTLTYWGNVTYDITVDDATFSFSGQTSGNDDTVSYDLFFGGTEITSTAVTRGGPDTSSNTSPLKITYTGNQFLTPDTYEDTITFTISATN